MIQIESQENLEREMKSIGVNIDKEFLINNRQEEMRTIISDLTEQIDSKVDNVILIDKVQDYEKFVKESELKLNKTIEDKAEESKREMAIKKVMAETLIGRLENQKELSEEKLKEEIKLEKENLAEKSYSDKVISTAVENAKVSVPEKLVEQEVNSMFEQFTGNLSRQGLSFDLYEQFTGKGEADLKAEMKSDAENKIKTSFVLGEIAEVEKVEVTEADIDAEVKELATMYNMTEEGIKQRISVEDLRGELVIQKTVDFLKANN